MSATPTTFNEVVIEALMLSAKRHKRFLHPIIVLKGTDEIIDGHHRYEAAMRLAKEKVNIDFTIEELETDDPETVRFDLNKCRRQWDDAEERRTIAQALAKKQFSNYVIADALGVGEATIRRDLELGPSASNDANGQHPTIRHQRKRGTQTYTVPSIADEDRIIELANDGMGQMQIIREINKDQEILLSRKNVRTILDNHGLSGAKPKTTTKKEQTDGISTEGEQPARGQAELLDGSDTAEPETTSELSIGSEQADSDDEPDEFNMSVGEYIKHHNEQVQADDSVPDTYKRASQLCAELLELCTGIFYTHGNNGWTHHEYAHIASDLKAAQKLIGDKAEETSHGYFQQCIKAKQQEASINVTT